MRRPRRTLTTGLMALALLVAGCGGGDESIAGTYNCSEEGNPEAPVEDWELREDGTLTITSPGRTLEGTWSAEGDSVVVTIEGQEDTFSIEGDRLVAAEPPTGFVCTPS
jgi:hypothetical protein